MNDTELAHIAGLLDGAGAVTVHISQDDNYAIGYRYNPLVSITRPKADKATLGKLDSFAAEYSIKCNFSEVDKSVEFRVHHYDSIDRVLDLLAPWLTTRHQQATIMQDDILPGLRANDHKTKDGFYELVGYADRLRNITRRGTKATYTQNYFDDEWATELSS